jgi:hypothetical protein
MADDGALIEAIQLIKAGRKGDAQLVLEPYILANPQDIRAWMWEAEIFPEDQNKIRVLEICLEHNPGHPQVIRAVDILRVRAGLSPHVETFAPEPESVAEERIRPTVPAPVKVIPPKTPQPAPRPGTASRPAAKPAPQKKTAPQAILRKHPDWPTVDGIVEVSEIHVVHIRRVPTYYVEIRAMYVAKGRDYNVKFPHARRVSASSMDMEILTSNYPPGRGITVSYDPRNPRRAWVDEWDPRVVRQKLREFKNRPEVRKIIVRRYRNQMLTGLGVAAIGIAAIFISSLIFSSGGYIVIFYGAITLGVLYFIIGLVGWLWNTD